MLYDLINLDPKKTSGSDGLDPFLIKVTAPIIAEPLSHLFSLSFHCAEVPSAWKEAVVSPLFKGGDQAEPENLSISFK